MAVNGTGSLVILVIVVLIGVLTSFQAQVQGKSQDNYKQDKGLNVSRIFDHTKGIDAEPKKAKAGKFPWQVLVTTVSELGKGICGGSIIDQHWIMSAAHCFATPLTDKEGNGYSIIKEGLIEVKVKAGLLDKTGELSDGWYMQERSMYGKDFMGKSRHLFIHEEYNSPNGVRANNDIALLKLKLPLKLDWRVYPILLATLEDVHHVHKKQTPLIASGWGRMSFNKKKPFPNELRYTTRLKLVQMNKCQAPINKKDETTMLCTENKKKHVGSGDSGGPIVFEERIHKPSTFVQIGIVHRGSTLEGKYWNLFMNVAHFRPWIHKTMGYSPDDKDYPPGFFRSSGIWYRMFKGEKVNYEDARSKCRSIGMRLAEPKDDTVVALKRNIQDNFGDVSPWVGAQGKGDKFVFKVGGHALPLYHPTMSYGASFFEGEFDKNCLFIMKAVDLEHFNVIVTYDIGECTAKKDTLCEDSPDTSIDNVCLGDARAIITQSGSRICVLPTEAPDVLTTETPDVVTTTTSCPDDEDFFTLTVGGPLQCFKAIEEVATWEQANATCTALNLTLAQPFAPVQLRSYLVQEYGPDFDVWLGACQDEPKNMTWKRGGEEITRDNPFWYPLQPKDDEGCLLLLSNKKYLKKKPMQPYRNVKSTKKFHPLCEWLPTEVTLTTEVKTTTEIVPTTVTVPKISCPDDEDYFTQNETEQCFKIIPQKATWEKADEECKKLNLTLAQPDAPIQLRSYLVNTYEPEPFVWLGACQDEPNKMTWKRGGEEIPFADPLWYPGQPDHDEGCLLLLARDDYLEEEPEKPFWNVLPTYEFYPLCEMVLE